MMNSNSETPANGVNNVLVLGGGTAGFLSALALRRRLPQSIQVSVLQSSKLGIIGVGEGSLRQLPNFLHDYLGIDPARFYREVQPTWKLGIRFKWGQRGDFNYTFAPQLDVKHPHPDLPRNMGYYCFDEMENHCVASVLMRNNFVCLADKNGQPEIGENVGYHLDNHRFASFLQTYAVEQGIEIVDDLVTDVELDEQGVKTLRLETGNSITADLFVDCSGFKSMLLGEALLEPFVSYKNSLFCDRALIGGWERTDEPVKPYTTSETMEAGWSWQIEHLDRINRGYVFSADFIDTDQAEQEFRARNPKIKDVATVRYRSGRYENCWVKNVVAIGNSAGFVEPLEATAIAAICSTAKALAETLAEADGDITPSIRKAYNQFNARNWDTIADFLAIHYKYNTLIENEFWRACQADVDIRGAQPIIEYYQENGPSSLWRIALEDELCRFRLDGYYTLLVGQSVPHAKMGTITAKEKAAWKKLQQATAAYASKGFTVPQAFKLISDPRWKWQPKHYAA